MVTYAMHHEILTQFMYVYMYPLSLCTPLQTLSMCNKLCTKALHCSISLLRMFLNYMLRIFPIVPLLYFIELIV